MSYVKCTKKLQMQSDNEISFRKGGIYKVLSDPNAGVSGNTRVIDEQNHEHTLGIWAQYFRKVDKKEAG